MSTYRQSEASNDIYWNSSMTVACAVCRTMPSASSKQLTRLGTNARKSMPFSLCVYPLSANAVTFLHFLKESYFKDPLHAGLFGARILAREDSIAHKLFDVFMGLFRS